VLLYDTVHGTSDIPDVMGILARKLRKSCEATFTVKGFSPDGDIVIEMSPTRKGVWLLNWRRKTLEPLAGGANIMIIE